MVIVALAAAAGPETEAPVNLFSTNDNSQVWVDFLGSAFDGLTLLPFALFFVWGIHRLNLNRWLPLTSALGVVLAVVVTGLAHDYIAPIFIFNDQMLEAIGVDRFRYLLMPALLVCFVGGLALAWWLRRKRRLQETDFSPEIIE